MASAHDPSYGHRNQESREKSSPALADREKRMFFCETKGRIHEVTCLSCGFLHAASSNVDLLFKVMEIHKAWHVTQAMNRKKKPRGVTEPPHNIVAAQFSLAA